MMSNLKFYFCSKTMAADDMDFELDCETGVISYIPPPAKFEDIPLTMSWLEQAYVMPPSGWILLFKELLPTLTHIYNTIWAKRLVPYYPLDRDVFAAYWYTPMNRVRVVIFGQDPYHDEDYAGRPSATGLAFSLNPDVMDINPSLLVIFDALRICYPGWQPKNNGCLKHWCDQGVMLLNQCLTVMPHTPKSHCRNKSNIWSHFISKTIEFINETNPFTIFVLWGRDAQDNLTEFIKARDESFIITAPHPSPAGPLSSRQFKESKQFLKINDKLMAIGQQPIDW